jgi:hypothetical protein
MIIPLSEATLINPNIDQDYLDGLEAMIRKYTNNNFQNRRVRLTNAVFIEPNIIQTGGAEQIIGFRVNDTIEVNNSNFNDNLYVIESLDGQSITVKQPEKPFIAENTQGAIVTLVQYPKDVMVGVKKLIEYDLKMRDKVGIKSETISRMSTTYYDVNSTESIEGYPAMLLKFLNKYKKLRW